MRMRPSVLNFAACAQPTPVLRESYYSVQGIKAVLQRLNRVVIVVLVMSGTNMIWQIFTIALKVHQNNEGSLERIRA